jgi:hypothetical protein
MVIKLDAETGKCVHLERVIFPEFVRSTVGRTPELKEEQVS